MYGGIVLLGAVGTCKQLFTKGVRSFQNQSIAMLIIAFLAALGLLLLLNLKAFVFSGKYLFIVIAPIAIVTCVGFRSVFPPGLRNYAFTSLIMILLIVNIDVLFRVLKPAYADTQLITQVDQPEFCCRTTEITQNSTIGQTFTSPENNLCAIQILFANKNRLDRGKITFSLREENQSGKLIAQIDMPIKNVHDTRFFFIFPPIKNSAGGKYAFSFSSSFNPGKGISLWYESKDCYVGGHIFKNGKPVSGDLFFTAYYFKGNQPRSDWQGRRQTVIRKGEYITVRELQLYLETPKALREQSKTHEKMKRLLKFMIK